MRTISEINSECGADGYTHITYAELQMILTAVGNCRIQDLDLYIKNKSFSERLKYVFTGVVPPTDKE